MQSWDFIANPPFGVTSKEGMVEAIDWEMLKSRLSRGTILSGKIFARAIFGVFFDAGNGFPVRMNITDFGKPEGNMKWPDDYPALDSEIRGVFNWFDDSYRQLVVIGLDKPFHQDIADKREQH